MTYPPSMRCSNNFLGYDACRHFNKIKIVLLSCRALSSLASQLTRYKQTNEIGPIDMWLRSSFVDRVVSILPVSHSSLRVVCESSSLSEFPSCYSICSTLFVWCSCLCCPPSNLHQHTFPLTSSIIQSSASQYLVTISHYSSASHHHLHHPPHLLPSQAHPSPSSPPPSQYPF